MDAAALGRFIHAQGIDLCYSWFARSLQPTWQISRARHRREVQIGRTFASDRARAVIRDHGCQANSHSRGFFATSSFTPSCASRFDL